MKWAPGLLVFAVAAAMAFAQGTPADPIIELPKVVVTDTRELPPAESWRYATIAGFEILSNASDRATQRLLRDFDMFRQALGYVWPAPDRRAPATTLIICGRGNTFAAFLPTARGAAEVATASLFLKQGDHAAIVVNLQATTLNILDAGGGSDAANGTDAGTISVEHDKQLYREYVHYLMSQAEPRSPAWLEEGLAQIVMKMDFGPRYVSFAKLEDPNAISPEAAMVRQLNADLAADDPQSAALPGAPAEDRDFATALRRRALVPMDKFFAIAHDAPEAANPLGNNRWAKQAYAFVHLCLYGYKGKYEKALMTFLQRSAREPVTEAMFKECFKLSYDRMLLEIRSYCETTVYDAKMFQSKKGGPDMITIPPPLPLREATQSEIGRIKGDALVLAGHPPAARGELIAPYIRGERDPELLAALGMFEHANGDPERSRKFLEAAFAGKAKRPDACIELARQRYADAVAKPAGDGGRLSAAQVAAITGPLLLARGQPPLSVALYDVAGDTWVRSAVKPKLEEAALLIEGAQLFPMRLKLVYQAGVLAADVGELQAAHALADHGLKYAPDATTKKRFEELKAVLPPMPAPSATPPVGQPAAPKK